MISRTISVKLYGIKWKERHPDFYALNCVGVTPGVANFDPSDLCSILENIRAYSEGHRMPYDAVLQPATESEGAYSAPSSGSGYRDYVNTVRVNLCISRRTSGVSTALARLASAAWKTCSTNSWSIYSAYKNAGVRIQMQFSDRRISCTCLHILLQVFLFTYVWGL